MTDAADVPVVSDAPRLSARTLWQLALLAVVVRAAYTLITAKLRGIPLSAYPAYGDGGEIIEYGRWLLGRAGVPSDYVARQFPGMPVTVAGLLLLPIPLWVSMLVFQWGMAALFVAAGAALYRDWRIGVALVFLVPDTLLVTGGATAAEGPMLALGTLGLLCAVRGRPIAGGLLLGAAGVYRPMACFAVLGYLCYAASRREWRAFWVVGVLSAAVVGVALLGVRWAWGDA